MPTPVMDYIEMNNSTPSQLVIRRLSHRVIIRRTSTHLAWNIIAPLPTMLLGYRLDLGMTI
jgi:hypothetical protein